MVSKSRRILLKLSGEALSGSGGFGVNISSLDKFAEEIKKTLSNNKIQLAIVIGGGNIWRGAGKEIDRVKADYMGMMATIINALAMQSILEKHGLKACVQSAIEVSKIAEFYMQEKTIKYLEEGYIVILAGGTGNPYFTTDTTAALRAVELKADVLLKATQVDGVYDSDPKKNKDAKKYKQVSFDEAISKNLKIMDTAAFSLCKENDLSIIVFNFHASGNLDKVLSGKNIGTLISK